MPGFIKPQLASLTMKAPSGPYLHEIKYDCYRVQFHLEGDAWVKRFPALRAP